MNRSYRAALLVVASLIRLRRMRRDDRPDDGLLDPSADVRASAAKAIGAAELVAAAPQSPSSSRP